MGVAGNNGRPVEMAGDGISGSGNGRSAEGKKKILATVAGQQRPQVLVMMTGHRDGGFW